MKITLLGTSSAEGWPGLFCRCAACAKARQHGGKDLRTRSSALIDDVLKIDFPPDILHQVVAQNVDLCALKAVLFTHAHDDHIRAAELQYMGPYFVTEVRAERLPIFGPADVIERLRATLDLERIPVALHTVQSWETFCIAGYHITAVPAQHDPSQVCFNYLIEDAAGATLLYATDTGWYEELTWNYLQQQFLDAIVVECAKGPVEEGYKGHLSIPDVLRMRQRLLASGSFTPTAPFVTTHLSHLGGLMHDEMETLFAPHNIQTGYDGMTFTVAPPAPAERRRRHLAHSEAQTKPPQSSVSTT